MDMDQPSQIWAEDANGRSLSTAWNRGHGPDGINQEECRVIRKVGLGVTAKETFRKGTEDKTRRMKRNDAKAAKENSINNVK